MTSGLASSYVVTLTFSSVALSASEVVSVAPSVWVSVALGASSALSSEEQPVRASVVTSAAAASERNGRIFTCVSFTVGVVLLLHCNGGF